MRRSLTRWSLQLLIVLLLVPALPATTQADTHRDEAPPAGQAKVLITLFSDTSAHGDPPQLHYSLIANTTVAGDPDHREIQLPLPHGARLHELRPQREGEIEPPTTRTRIDDNGSWALAEWDTNGPLPGQDLTMLMEARQEVDPDHEIPIEWDRLPVTLTTIWLALPSGYTPKLETGQTLKREDTLSGLALWNLTDPAHDRLSLRIEPLDIEGDPSLAVPPPAWSAFAVLFALALISGGIWLLGKKAEARKARKEREEHPPP